jgi:hypothetical protein
MLSQCLGGFQNLAGRFKTPASIFYFFVLAKSDCAMYKMINEFLACSMINNHFFASFITYLQEGMLFARKA